MALKLEGMREECCLRKTHGPRKKAGGRDQAEVGVTETQTSLGTDSLQNTKQRATAVA